METKILHGKPVADEIYIDLSRKIEKMPKKPYLVVFLIGDDPASKSYVVSKAKAAKKIGIREETVVLSPSTKEKELEYLIKKCAEEDDPDGILVQFPLPRHINPEKIILSIPPEKDVDGLHPQNLGSLMRGTAGHYPCTPSGVIELMKYYGIHTKGKNAVVLGRSLITGKPMANLLLDKAQDATVTVCHSSTPDISSFTTNADIVISAVGKPEFLKSEMVREGSTVIDIGVNRIPSASSKSGYVLKGDADFENLLGRVSGITPVPGGVGLLTVAMLMRNTVESALLRENKNGNTVGLSAQRASEENS